MPHSSRQRYSSRQLRQRGFTLLELVIAMACVGLVAGGIALSITTCINVWNRSAESAEIQQEARALLEMISRDLRGLYLGLDQRTGYLVEMEGVQVERGSRVDTFELSTHGYAPERFALLPDDMRQSWDPAARPPLTDYVAVRYEWREETSDQPAGLYRVTSAVPSSEAAAEGAPEGEGAASEDIAVISRQLISTSVVGLELSYYDATDETWVDAWDSTADPNRVLLDVSVKLTLRDARGRNHVFRTTVPISSY